MKNLSAKDQHRPQQNALIAALSAAECDRLANDLELIPLALGQVLYESGQTMSHAYFPIDCVVSILYVMKNGESAEIAIVGNEGMIGIAVLMGGESTMSRAIVQNGGHAYRLKAQVLKDEFGRSDRVAVPMPTSRRSCLRSLRVSSLCVHNHLGRCRMHTGARASQGRP